MTRKIVTLSVNDIEEKLYSDQGVAGYREWFFQADDRKVPSNEVSSYDLANAEIGKYVNGHPVTNVEYVD